MDEVKRLGAAVKVISEKYLGKVIAAGDKAGILKWSLRLADYSTRLAALVGAPPLTSAEAADTHVEPLSADPSVALVQLLSATGHAPTYGPQGESLAIDPSAVLADATPTQVAQLALLGFFGTSGTFTGVDYSLRARFYDMDADGNEAPKAAYATTGVWPAYLATL